MYISEKSVRKWYIGLVRTSKNEIGSYCNCSDKNDKQPFEGTDVGAGVGEFGEYLGDRID